MEAPSSPRVYALPVTSVAVYLPIPVTALATLHSYCAATVALAPSVGRATTKHKT